MLNMQKCAYEYKHSLQQNKYISLIDRSCHFASSTCFIIHIYCCHGKKLSVPIYSVVQMDSGLDVQFTCSCESPQVSKAKIRNSISPSTTGINHTSVTDRERWGGGKNRGENGRREWGWQSDEGCPPPLMLSPGAWYCMLTHCCKSLLLY